MSEIILILGLIVMFAMVTNGIIIYKQRNLVTVDDMGIEIEKKCPNLRIELLNEGEIQMSELTGTIIFVEEDCVTCQMLVRDIDSSGRKDENMVTVLVGGKEYATNFVKKYLSWKKVGFLERENIESNLNITAFPYFMVLEDGIVKEKGIAVTEKLLRD